MLLLPVDDGAEIRVEVGGSGPPIVLLHEWASSLRVWEPIARHLTERFTVYRWDARGHGGHVAHPAVPINLTRMADDLHAMIERFGLERTTLVGHSMGALTAWAYIARYGCNRLGRLCVIDQSPRLVTDETWRLGIYGDWPVGRDEAFIASMRADFVQAVVELVAFGLNRAARYRHATGHASVARMREYLARLDALPLIDVWATLSRADFRPLLPSISVPALLVYGAESNYYPAPTGPWVRDAIPDSRLLVYEGADHSPHVGQPERFVTDLEAFLA
jgi:non-heme chloroperoxidase